MEGSKPVIIEFPHHLHDIPRMLRELATEIEELEQEERPVVVILTLITPGEGDALLSVRGYGKISNNMETVGWLTKAIREIL